MIIHIRLWMLALLVVGLAAASGQAQSKTALARELAEYLLGKYGKKGLQKSLPALTREIEQLATRYGDDAFIALKKVGPQAFELVEQAGSHAPAAIKLMARRGGDAVWIVAKNNRMALFVKYGDDAAESMIKHGEIAEPLLEAFGKSAARALNAVSGQNARRLSMMQQSGELARIGRTSELLEVIGRYGDRAADFIWKHKGSLAVASVLAAFLADPEPFINGVVDISKLAAENVAKPMAEMPKELAVAAARSVNWTVVSVVGLILLALLTGWRWSLSHRKKASVPVTQR
ncbi:MAG: hypothetical protein NZ703_00305 [Gemmataceae bacterium]|nr:hypothetical protein [Gemmataceae bacterium]